ncbi:hypothetical protein KXD93_16745 [Mucilaginibacter sp. BJC16-A38]|uniref:hypothetical protein n=1 Tax=Mucilaginibacter phenanthrenivorans TaxID=1234842 RepID=UPI00215815B6|nr:hypothetical protein [Mucilaginibacter phenanthrenivorans]MCR8559308.1 hypothetical protein [Mucilaginibacter phenanthrenivorans]
MIGNLRIYELKPLKGPDRLLRIHVLIDDAHEMLANIEMLGEIVQALIFKYHKIDMEFPVSSIMGALPINPQFHGNKYGEFLNGVLGIEMLIMYKSNSIFKMRYYSEQLEFERKLMNIDTHILMNEIDMQEFRPQFTVTDLRNGIDAEPLQIKITYIAT